MSVYGDSMLGIIFMNEMSSLQNYTLQPLFQDIKTHTTLFVHLSFNHVYKNRNEGDKLSKVGLDMNRGSWKVLEKRSLGIA
jgi:hypothetical protein